MKRNLEDNWWTKSNKKLLNMKLRHVGITVIKHHYFIDITCICYRSKLTLGNFFQPR